MIYILSKQDTKNGTTYLLYESETESFFTGNDRVLAEISEKYKGSIKNITITGYEKTIKRWYRDLNENESENNASGAEYILLCKLDENNFKLASCDRQIKYLNIEQLTNCIKYYRVANCKIERNGYKSIDTYGATKNPQFEEQIAKKYERYTAMSAVMGREMAFDYIIEGTEVKLKQYTGVTKHVIVPKFITSIMKEAFDETKIESIELENGLKSIGSYAFENCNLAKIIIPETVQLIGTLAFFGNRRLVTNDYDYKEAIQILNKNTIVMDNIKWNEE